MFAPVGEKYQISELSTFDQCDGFLFANLQIQQAVQQKSRIRDKKNLLTDADSRTDTILEVA